MNILGLEDWLEGMEVIHIDFSKHQTIQEELSFNMKAMHLGHVATTDSIRHLGKSSTKQLGSHLVYKEFFLSFVIRIF